MLERHIYSRVALLGRCWSGIWSGLVLAGIYRKDRKWRRWRGSDAEQSTAEWRKPNLRWVGRRREEDDWVGMQQRTEMEKKAERRGRERVGSEKQGKNRDEREMGAVAPSRSWIEGRRSPTKASEMLQETHGVILLVVSISWPRKAI